MAWTVEQWGEVSTFLVVRGMAALASVLVALVSILAFFILAPLVGEGLGMMGTFATGIATIVGIAFMASSYANR